MKNFIILFFLCLSSLTACSRLDFAFDWADTYIASQVDEYFDISFHQNRSLKKAIRTDLDRIKSTVLPDLLNEAKDIKKNFSADDIDKNKISDNFSAVLEKIHLLSSSFSGTALAFISGISQKQIEHFTTAFHQKNYQDLQKLNEDYKNKTLKKYLKYFEMFLGSLTEAQEKIIETHIIQSPFPAELKIKNKEWVFQQFMKQRSSLVELKVFMRDLLSEPEKLQLPKYRQALQKYYLSLQTLLLDISKTLTADQKSELLENLQDRIDQLEKIRSHG